MRRSRYTEEQIAFALRQAESGTPVAEVIRKMGITEPTFYLWTALPLQAELALIGVGQLQTSIRRHP
jgi:transposase-like protein